ncbi:MAG: S1 RNA-binding domain-containing protein [Defluviitaleaceae bacterium]|nr:S1 RNA-binding domain-containing protein [Defluviitaleaceae bacterium]
MAEMTMEELMNLEGMRVPTVGDVVTGKVIAIAGQEVTVDIGGGKDATIYLSELSADHISSANDAVSIGSEIEAVVKKVSDEQILLSVKAVAIRAQNAAIEKALEDGSALEATVTRIVRGGLLVDLNGVEAFLPASQLDVRYVENLDSYMGQTFKVKVESIKRGRIAVTRKELIAAEREAAKAHALTSLNIGDRVAGKVVRITTFGAFVDFGAVEGLVHLSEISHTRFKKIEDVLTVGDDVQAEVIKIDNDKIGLSIKKVLPTPIELFDKTHQVGDVLVGNVVSVHDYGAFVEVAPGVEGLVHTSELSWESARAKVSDFLTAGKKTNVKIININVESGRVALSIKQIESDPWDALALTVGDVVVGKVESLTQIGAFINIAPYIDGLCHFSEASWSTGTRLEDLVKVGDDVQVKVISLDKERKRVGLSLRQVTSNPWDDLTVRRGDIVTGTIVNLNNRGAEVQVAEGVVGFLPIGQITERRLNHPNETLSMNEEIQAKVTHFEPNSYRLELSVRQIAEDAERADFDAYMKVQNQEVSESAETLGDLFKDTFKNLV